MIYLHGNLYEIYDIVHGHSDNVQIYDTLCFIAITFMKFMQGSKTADEHTAKDYELNPRHVKKEK